MSSMKDRLACRMAADRGLFCTICAWLRCAGRGWSSSATRCSMLPYCLRCGPPKCCWYWWRRAWCSGKSGFIAVYGASPAFPIS